MKKKCLSVLFSVTLLFVTLINVGSAAEKKPILWKMTSCWTPTYDLMKADEYFVKLVNQLAAGELKIEFSPGGTIVPVLQVFDAVQGGIVQIAGDFPGYWAGKDTAFYMKMPITTCYKKTFILDNQL